MLLNEIETKLYTLYNNYSGKTTEPAQCFIKQLKIILINLTKKKIIKVYTYSKKI